MAFIPSEACALLGINVWKTVLPKKVSVRSMTKTWTWVFIARWKSTTRLGQFKVFMQIFTGLLPLAAAEMPGVRVI